MSRRVIFRWAVISGAMGCLLALSAGVARSQSPPDSWFRIPLKGGELHGTKWGLAAKGSRESPLKQVCAVVSEIGPIDPDAGYVEASETSSCGSLQKPSDSISLRIEFGAENSNATVLRTALYPRIVRRVTFVLAGGEELSYKAKGIKVKNRKAKGIPFFRFLVARFDAEACIQQVIRYDGRGRVIKREDGEEGCPRS